MPKQDISQPGETGAWRARMPVVARYSAQLSDTQRARCAAVADGVGLDRSLARDRLYFGPFARPAAGDAPFVFFGDTGETRRVAARSSGVLEYRLSLLAGTGDLVVIGGARNPDFEAYVETWLGLGRRQYLQIEAPAAGPIDPAQIRCLSDPAAYAALRSFAGQSGRATLVPYLGSGAVWMLARRLAEDTDATLSVAGPPPSITEAANDKLVFSSVVRALLGQSAAPREVSAHGPAALAGRVHAIARDCRKLVVKLPNSAGSAGNFPLFSADVAGMSAKDLHRHLVTLLGAISEPQSFPMIVQVWQNSVFSSPSLQLWIPHRDDGPPIIEGVFYQIVTGQEGRFSGARPAGASEAWIPEFCRQGLMLGQVFQQIGYFGRCSFDAVLFGEDAAAPRLQWLECNGRWGGVSIPMTLLNRLFRGAAPPPYVIAHLPQPNPLRRSFAEGLDIVGDLLWKPGADKGIIFMTPGGFETGAELHLISLAPTATEADRQLEQVAARLSA